MSKIVVFNGSPREHGITKKLMNEVIRGAESKGAETVYYDLNVPGIRPCQGCFYCRGNEGCSEKNDVLAPMYEDIKSADAIILGAPVYFYQISGQAKVWLDRMWPVVGVENAPRYPGKKFVSIFAQGNPDPNRHSNVMDETNLILKMFGWDMIDSITLSGTIAPDYSVPEEQMTQAYEDGKKLVN